MKIKSFLKLLKMYFNPKQFGFLLNSFQGLLIDILKNNNILKRFKKRKNGISVLLPTQNEERLVRLSILSFLDFADEIIVVDNGSIDGTKKIVKSIAEKFQKVKFFDRPELPDLYHNRQFALSKSNYRWICRFDSDYVAYNEGENDIKKLRKKLLNTSRGIVPKVFSIPRINLGGDFWHIRDYDFVLKKYNYPIISGPEMRIYEYFPLFSFYRFKKREFGAFQIYMKEIETKQVYIMHCNIKSDISYFLRAERANWRGTGKFRKYPTILSYIKSIIKEKYGTNKLKEALDKFLKSEIYKKKYYKKYDPNRYLPYPSLIAEEMKKKHIFRLEKYFSE